MFSLGDHALRTASDGLPRHRVFHRYHLYEHDQYQHAVLSQKNLQYAQGQKQSSVTPRSLALSSVTLLSSIARGSRKLCVLPTSLSRILWFCRNVCSTTHNCHNNYSKVLLLYHGIGGPATIVPANTPVSGFSTPDAVVTTPEPTVSATVETILPFT